MTKIVTSLSGSPKSSNLLSLGKIALISCLLTTSCDKLDQNSQVNLPAVSKDTTSSVSKDTLPSNFDEVSNLFDDPSQCGRKPSN